MSIFLSGFILFAHACLDLLAYRNLHEWILPIGHKILKSFIIYFSFVSLLKPQRRYITMCILSILSTQNILYRNMNIYLKLSLFVMDYRVGSIILLSAHPQIYNWSIVQYYIIADFLYPQCKIFDKFPTILINVDLVVCNFFIEKNWACCTLRMTVNI